MNLFLFFFYVIKHTKKFGSLKYIIYTFAKSINNIFQKNVVWLCRAKQNVKIHGSEIVFILFKSLTKKIWICQFF